MLPVIALVGRPNVGKSTLFNRLTRSRDALVSNYVGLTRDRLYGEIHISERRILCVDTGGLVDTVSDGVEELLLQQSLLAIEEADLVFFVLDVRVGLLAADIAIAKRLRQDAKSVVVVANKVDGMDPNLALAPFYELGFASLFAISANQGRGVTQLLEHAVGLFDKASEMSIDQSLNNSVNITDASNEALLNEPAQGMIPEPSKNSEQVKLKVSPTKVAIVGRPNVGKSTLVNRLLGENRVVVFDMPGTTRDSIYIDYARHDKPYVLIDTAGIRRRKNVKETVEKFSIIKTLQAIEDANVVVLLLDAREGVVDQDLHLVGHVIDSGRGLVIALNKWDGLDLDSKTRIKHELTRRLRFIDFAQIHYISALHGTGVGHLYASIDEAHRSSTERFSANYLTNVLKMAVSEHQPPVVGRFRIKLRFAHPGGHNPPIIVIHGNQTQEIPGHYVRYLEKSFRRALKLQGTPIRLQFKSSENPYASKKSSSHKRFDTNAQGKLKKNLLERKGHLKKTH